MFFYNTDPRSEVFLNCFDQKKFRGSKWMPSYRTFSFSVPLSRLRKRERKKSNTLICSRWSLILLKAHQQLQAWAGYFGPQLVAEMKRIEQDRIWRLNRNLHYQLGVHFLLFVWWNFGKTAGSWWVINWTNPTGFDRHFFDKMYLLWTRWKYAFHVRSNATSTVLQQPKLKTVLQYWLSVTKMLVCGVW